MDIGGRGRASRSKEKIITTKFSISILSRMASKTSNIQVWRVICFGRIDKENDKGVNGFADYKLFHLVALRFQVARTILVRLLIPHRNNQKHLKTSPLQVFNTVNGMVVYLWIECFLFPLFVSQKKNNYIYIPILGAFAHIDF